MPEARPGTVHDDRMIVVPDEMGKPARAIYFDNERHTIEYATQVSDSSIRLTGKKEAGVPVFRLTYVPQDTESIAVEFEISRDGILFRTYTERKCRRKP